MAAKPHMGTHRTLEVDLVSDLTFSYSEARHRTTVRVHDETYAPKSVLSKVSFASQTLNHPPFSSLSNSVTVRHAPLTAMESPMWQSDRIAPASAMTIVQPPSSRSMAETVPRCSI